MKNVNNTKTTKKTSTTTRQKCEVYSRPVGYLRTISSWNDAKKEEFFDRKTYVYDSKY